LIDRLVHHAEIISLKATATDFNDRRKEVSTDFTRRTDGMTSTHRITW
jgi:hypothetical protein